MTGLSERQVTVWSQVPAPYFSRIYSELWTRNTDIKVLFLKSEQPHAGWGALSLDFPHLTSPTWTDVAKHARRRGWHIVHGYRDRRLILAALLVRSFGGPRMLSPFFDSSIEDFADRSASSQVFQRWLVRSVFGANCRPAQVSKSNSDYWKSIGYSKMVDLPYGVPPSWGEETYRISLESRQFDVVHVGRLTAQKGLDALADSWSRVVDVLPDASLLLVGATEDARLRVRLSSLPGASVEEGVPWEQVPSTFERGRVAVFPSHREAFGLALVEAAASGCVLASSARIPSLREIASVPEDSLFDSRDAHSLSEALIRSVTLARSVRDRLPDRGVPLMSVEKYMTALEGF